MCVGSVAVLRPRRSSPSRGAGALVGHLGRIEIEFSATRGVTFGCLYVLSVGSHQRLGVRLKSRLSTSSKRLLIGCSSRLVRLFTFGLSFGGCCNCGALGEPAGSRSPQSMLIQSNCSHFVPSIAERRTELSVANEETNLVILWSLWEDKYCITLNTGSGNLGLVRT